MQHIIEVENIKCGGCANTITRQLEKIPDVDDVSVDIDNGRVTVGADENRRAAIIAALHASGYPEKGTAEGIKAAGAKARSFVSCAIGRMS
ncbi:MAG: heavy-metal-associated domain-containing protein [Gammaproteobacteria bacterium]